MSKSEQIGNWPSAAAGQWPVTYGDWQQAERDLEAYEAERVAAIEKKTKRVQPRQPKPPSEPKPPRLPMRLPGETSRQFLKRRVIERYLAGEIVAKPEHCIAWRRQVQSIINTYLQSRDAVVDDSAPRPTAPAGTLGQFNAPGGSLVPPQE